MKKRKHQDEDVLGLLFGIIGHEDAQKLLIKGYRLRELADMQVSDIVAKYGICEEQAVRLGASVRLAKRVATEPARFVGTTLTNSADTFRHFSAKLNRLEVEQFWVGYLNGKHIIKGTYMVSQGTLTSSPVHPRDTFREAIRQSAAAIILCHNHPSGDPTPSADDIEITNRLAQVGELVGIRVLDHVIIGAGTYVSLAERGLIGG